MNKAFVSEKDSEEKEEGLPYVTDAPSGRNYMTPAGARSLQDELRRLKFQERPEVVRVVEWAAGNGDRSENGDYIYGKKRLREIDRRINFLGKRLAAIEVVDPLKVKSNQVLFGATVRIRDESDREKTYSIVGIDEADAARGRISWMSPLAKALLKGREGDVVQCRSPGGVQEIEILEISYKALE